MADCFISKIVESYIGLMLNIQYHNTKIWSPTSLHAEVGLSFYRDDPLYFISRLFIGDSFALRSNNTSSAFLFGTLINIFMYKWKAVVLGSVRVLWFLRRWG